MERNYIERKKRRIHGVYILLCGMMILVMSIFGWKILGFSWGARDEVLQGAKVQVRITPDDSNIRFGNIYQANAELFLNNIQSGEYMLEASRNGFKTYEEAIRVAEGEELTRDIALEPLLFELSFDSKPKNAEYHLVLRDGSKKQGKSPFKGAVYAGNIKIKLTFPGYNILERDLFLEGDHKEIFYLDPRGQLLHHLRNITLVTSPKGLAFSRDNKEIWVTSLLNKKAGIKVYKPSTGEKVKDINLNGGGGVEVIFSHDGGKSYVSQMETAKVFEIDTASKEILRAFDAKSSWTKELELSEDGKTLFASNWVGDDVSEIDLQTGKLRRRIPTVDTPRGLYATKDGTALYVAGFGRGEIQRIDLETGKGKIIFKSGGAMRHIVGDEEKEALYVSDMAKAAIWQVSLKNDEVKKFAATDHNPNTIALSPDKKVLFVSCRGANNPSGNYYIKGREWGSVLLFDTESGKMLDAIVGGNQPTGLDVSLDGKLLVFSDFLDATLEVFEVPSYDILKEGSGDWSEVYKSQLKK